jgi:hypothetical protein
VGENAPAAHEKQVRIAVSILPTTAGESAILHIINRPVETLKTVELGAAGAALQQHELLEISDLKMALQHLKSGALFLTGSPYSDRITTLYSILQELDYVRKNIVTLESYTEYSTDKYSQIRYWSGSLWDTIGYDLSTSPSAPLRTDSEQLHTPTRQSSEPEKPLFETQQDIIMTGDGTTLRSAKPFNKLPSTKLPSTKLPSTKLRTGSIYNPQLVSQIPNPAQKVLASWLSALKNQDADVALVDWIGSDVVLFQCLNYAAHHLLLGAFDVKHIFEMLAYCLDCQVKPSVLASRVYALLAQQSVHILCQECKQQDTTEFGKRFIERLPLASVEIEEKPKIFAPVGCHACHMTGYTHYVVLFEVLKMEPWLKEMLTANTPLSEIRDTAVEKGFSSIEQKSIELLLTGETSIEQIFSIIT